MPSFVDELVTANHILFRQGVLDAFGHVSVRHPEKDGCFLLSRSLAPALVAPHDILTFQADGSAEGPNPPPVYLERFIHAEIYRVRPDVMAVIHSHSPSVIPFSAVKATALRPIYHMCGFLGAGARHFDIRDVAGNSTDLLIKNRELGAALANALADASVVLMRGHGVTVVGQSLRQTVFRAVYTEIGARLQADAIKLGPVTYLSRMEADAASRANDTQIDRAWEMWKVRS